MRHATNTAIIVLAGFCTVAPALAAGPSASPRYGAPGVHAPVQPAYRPAQPLARPPQLADRPVAAATPPVQRIIRRKVIVPVAAYGGYYPYLWPSDSVFPQPSVIEPPREPRGRRGAYLASGYPGPGAYGGWRAPRAEPRPYAPPSITIIGEPSRRHMRGPVHLVHGVAAKQRSDLDPRVVFLQQTRGGLVPVKSAE